MSTARAIWHRFNTTPLQQQATAVLTDIKHDLSWSLDNCRPTDPVLRYLRMSNRLNTVWGALKHTDQYPSRMGCTGDIYLAAMDIAREAVNLAAECQVSLKAQQQADREAAAQHDWFEAVEAEADLPEPSAQQQTERLHAENVNHITWAVRLALVAAALLGATLLTGCGGGGDDLADDTAAEQPTNDERRAPLPPPVCLPDPKLCI